MNMPQLIAWMRGYDDYLFDLKCLTVHIGYWAGYYNNAKHPKSLSSILRDLNDEYLGQKEIVCDSKASDDIEANVEQFKQREQRFAQFRG